MADTRPMPRRRRQSTRLRGYDYRQAGAYFVTICTDDRACLLGDVIDGEMALSAIGYAVRDCWQAIPDHTAGVTLDGWVVMPNHLHGLLVFDGGSGADTATDPGVDGAAGLRLGADPGIGSDPGHRSGAIYRAPTSAYALTLGVVMQTFKAASTRRVNAVRETPGAPLWQRNYYERIVRGDGELDRIRTYIAANPARWADDENNPTHLEIAMRRLVNAARRRAGAPHA